MKRQDSYAFAGDLVPPWVWKTILSLVYFSSAALAVVYGVCAFQYGLFNLFGPHGPFKGTPQAIGANWTRWNDHVFAPLSCIDYFQGKGSLTLAQTLRYGRNWYFMSPHQMAGGTMILCSIILMNPKLRYGSYAKWHRIAGDIYVVAHLFSLYGSLGYLIKHTFQGWAPKTYPENIEASISHGGIYGGSVFVMILWLYWLAAALSLTLGVVHILRGQVQRHRAWMSVNYGTTMGAAFLRIYWAFFAYLFPEYRMDEINNSAVILFIVTMLWVAAGHSSLAHRKRYAYPGSSSFILSAVIFLFGLGSAAIIANQSLFRFGAFGLEPTPDLNRFFGGTPTLTAIHVTLFDKGKWAHVTAATAHVVSWSVGLVAGGILLPRVFNDPVTAACSWLGHTYIAAAFCIFLTSISALGAPVSFSWFLVARMGNGHFYALMPRTLWDIKAVSVILKTFLFALAMHARDEARIVDWTLHSYGEIASYGLTLIVTWAFSPVCPTYEDAFAHAAVFSTLAGPLVAYIAAIYVMEPQPEQVSAFRNGLFWELRCLVRKPRPSTADNKSD